MIQLTSRLAYATLAPRRILPELESVLLMVAMDGNKYYMRFMLEETMCNAISIRTIRVSH